jgi:hypothetical protein
LAIFRSFVDSQIKDEGMGGNDPRIYALTAAESYGKRALTKFQV